MGREVLLRVLAAGLCHSDLHYWEGDTTSAAAAALRLAAGRGVPCLSLATNVGEVVAAGPDAHGVAVGDVRLRVSVDGVRAVRGVRAW